LIIIYSLYSQETPFVVDTMKGNNSFTGVARTILGVFREMLGFDWELVWAEDGSNDVGIWDENTGNFTGVHGLLQSGVNLDCSF